MTELQFFSYLYGFFLTDGAIKLNSNGDIRAVTLEVSIIDKEDILRLSQNTFLNQEEYSISYRTRDTNFKKDSSNIIWNCRDKKLMQFLEYNLFPKKDKTNICSIPAKEYDEDYFWAGVIDGDGSLGCRKVGTPFINLTTKSEFLKEDFLNYIEKYTNFRPKVNKNKRDSIYNITVCSQKALIISKKIYLDTENIFLQRKYSKAKEIQLWKPVQPKERTKCVKWTEEEEKDLLNFDIEDFLEKYPYRTLTSIKSKRQRLREKI